jgi:hypothetical protein
MGVEAERWCEGALWAGVWLLMLRNDLEKSEAPPTDTDGDNFGFVDGDVDKRLGFISTNLGKVQAAPSGPAVRVLGGARNTSLMSDATSLSASAARVARSAASITGFGVPGRVSGPTGSS